MAPRLFIAPHDFRAILRRIIELTPTTKHFEWEVLDETSLNSLAGQFLSLKVWRNGDQETRPYSITGTGIAPICGMLADLFTREVENSPEIWLLFGVRSPETILYRSEFERWATVIPGFHFVPILSRPPAE
jgi:ferredoxin-NADP reductase